MPFRVITKDAAQELAREFKGVTGARRHVADALLEQALDALNGETVTARTFPLVRQTLDDRLRSARAVLDYDGPTFVASGDATYTIEQDKDAPTQRERKATSKAARAAKWLGVKYANTCGTCGRQVDKGEQAFYDYDSRTLYCANGCGDAHEKALKAALGRAA